MARRPKKWTGEFRQLSEAELGQRFVADLDRLEQMCRDFDEGGRNYLAFYMAEHLQMMLADSSFGARRRGLVRFPTCAIDDNPKNIASYSRLTSIAFFNGGTEEASHGTFLPKFVGRKVTSIEYLKFSKWWQQLVLRKSAATPDADPPGNILGSAKPLIPYEEREALTRQRLIQMMRDYHAAHSQPELPTILESIDRPSAWGVNIVVPLNDGREISSFEGTLHWKTGQLAASIRQVAEEVLIAFGVRKLTLAMASD